MVNKSNFTERLNKAIANSGLSVPKIQDITGIDKENIYKWTKGKKPSDAEDYIKMVAWIDSHLESVPQETGTTEVYDSKEAILRMLDKSLDANTRHADANKENASSLKELVKLLALQFNSYNTGEASQPSKKKDTEQHGPFRRMVNSLDKSEIVVVQQPKGKKKKGSVESGGN